MFTHTLNRSWSRGSESIGATVTAEAGSELNIDESIPGNTTDALVAFVLDVSQLKSLFMLSDVDVMVETNATTGVNVFNLLAGVPYAWIVGDAAVRDTEGTAFTTDVTALYVTNGEADAAALQIRCLIDPTV